MTQNAIRTRPGQSVCVLGGFGLHTTSGTVSLPVGAQRVLAYLALTGSAQRRDVLAGRLWAEATQYRAQANLRTAVWRVRQASRGVVDGRRDSVGLSHEVGVDYQQMTQVAQTLLQQQLCAEELRRAPLDLLAADLLPGWDEEWLLIDRERHRQLRMHALEALAVQLTEVGDYGLAIDSAYLALAVEPLCESVNAALIRAYLAEGNRTEALRQYRLFQTQLADETGLRPSRQLSDLVAELTRLPRSAERRDFLPHPGSAPPGSSGVPLNRSREGPRGSTQRLTL